MRATIIAARVLGAAMMVWGAVLLVSAIWIVIHDPPFAMVDDFVEAETFWHFLSQPVAIIGIGMLLLVTVSILDELRRRPE